MKKRILMVDDEVELVDLLAVRLEVNGYEILTAYDGEAGLNKAKALMPDLILLDVMMPKMDGYEVCRQLKSDANCQHIPIVLLTAHTGEADKEMGRKAGANGYVTKPYEPAELLFIINEFLP